MKRHGKEERQQIAGKVTAEITRRSIERDYKDLSTADIEFRLDLHKQGLGKLESEITECNSTLTALRKSAGEVKLVVTTLEALLEARR